MGIDNQNANGTLCGRPITYKDFGIDIKTSQPVELVSWSDSRAKMAVLQSFHPDAYEFVKLLDKCQTIQVVDGGSGKTMKILKKVDPEQNPK